MSKKPKQLKLQAVYDLRSRYNAELRSITKPLKHEQYIIYSRKKVTMECNSYLTCPTLALRLTFFYYIASFISWKNAVDIESPESGLLFIKNVVNYYKYILVT